MAGDYDLLSGDRMPPLLVASRTADQQKAVMPKFAMTRSEVSLGVPRSPNRHLEELSALRQVDFSGHQIQLDRLAHIRSGLFHGFTG